MELVEVKKGKVFTTSLIFSEEFELPHRNMLIKIRELTAEFTAMKKEFEEGYYTNDRNRKYPMFYMTRKGFMFLVMNTGAKEQNMRKLWEMQIKIIDAFDYMEKQLLVKIHNEKNEEWLEMRKQVIENRKQETSIIKDFVEYAISQGSSNAKNYYMLISKETNKNLCFMQQKNPKLRETLNLLELGQLIIVENTIGEKLKKYMSEEVYYKEIYKKVMQDVREIVALLGVKRELIK